MKLLLDTNIFLELILKQQRQQEVSNLLLKIDEHEFLVSNFSVHSIGLLLCRKGHYQAFLEFLDDVFIEGGVSIVGLNIKELKKVIHAVQDISLDFDDAYQYVIAEKYDLTIVSFDTDFDRTERGRKTPAEIIGRTWGGRP